MGKCGRINPPYVMDYWFCCCPASAVARFPMTSRFVDVLKNKTQIFEKSKKQDLRILDIYQKNNFSNFQ
jgi:hypothetical protein